MITEMINLEIANFLLQASIGLMIMLRNDKEKMKVCIISNGGTRFRSL